VGLADKAIKLPFYLFQYTIGAVFTTHINQFLQDVQITWFQPSIVHMYDYKRMTWCYVIRKGSILVVQCKHRTFDFRKTNLLLFLCWNIFWFLQNVCIWYFSFTFYNITYIIEPVYFVITYTGSIYMYT
jgi:hypothetical protein